MAAIQGIGGAVASFNTPVSLVFNHDSDELTAFELDVSLLMDVASAGLPSLLGRDILFRGELRFSPDTGAVLFDAAKGSFVIETAL